MFISTKSWYPGHPATLVWLSWAVFLLIGGTGWAQQGGGGDAPLNLRGVVLPVQQSKLGFTQAGIVVALPLEGTEVKKGALIAHIDDSVAQQQMAKAKASLAKAQLTLQQAVHVQGKNRRLHAENILADMALAEGEFAITQGKIGVDISQSEVASARWALEGSRLVAPFDGVVSRVTAHRGEWLGAGAPALELVDLTQLEVSMDLPPDSLIGLEPGMETAVIIDGRRSGVAKARTILPLVDAASGLRRVIWSVIPGPDVVMAGRYVTLEGWKRDSKGGKP